MTPEEKRAAIDLICTMLLGWHKVPWEVRAFEQRGDEWVEVSHDPEEQWIDREGVFQGRVSAYDPFTDPSDCARVIKELDRRHLAWEIHSGCGAIVGDNKNAASADSWTTAFCESTLLLINSIERVGEARDGQAGTV